MGGILTIRKLADKTTGERLVRYDPETGVRKLVFVSSSGVYGEPRRVPCGEDHETKPLGEYGRSKLLAEQIETIDRGQIEAIRATGASPVQVLIYGVLPQVLPMMLSNTLYMFEHNVRSASILGIVGAGGIGFLLADRLRAYELQEACLIIILIILAVYAIDFLSKTLRERLIGDHRRREPVDDAAQT